jgi:hypothetical protein
VRGTPTTAASAVRRLTGDGLCTCALCPHVRPHTAIFFPRDFGCGLDFAPHTWGTPPPTCRGRVFPREPSNGFARAVPHGGASRWHGTYESRRKEIPLPPGREWRLRRRVRGRALRLAAGPALTLTRPLRGHPLLRGRGISFPRDADRVQHERDALQPRKECDNSGPDPGGGWGAGARTKGGFAGRRVLACGGASSCSPVPLRIPPNRATPLTHVCHPVASVRG